ncbi:MAG: hypothetical protein ACK4NZ_11230 [Tsuneonella sp.]
MISTVRYCPAAFARRFQARLDHVCGPGAVFTDADVARLMANPGIVHA